MTRRAILHPTQRNAIAWQEIQDPVPGALPEGRVAVVVDGQRKAHVSHRAGPSVAERLINRPVELGEHDGKPAWIARRASALKRADVSAVDQITSLKAAKGSVSEQPTRPDKARKPKR